MDWHFENLDVLTLECRLQACETARLPQFLGSTLRGAFGHTLKSVACVLEPSICSSGCQSELCAYGYGFETAIPAHRSPTGRHEDLPTPYVLIPPPLTGDSDRRFERGEGFAFSMRLFGRGTGLREFVTAALADIGRNGLGAYRAQFITTDIRPQQPETLGAMVRRRLAEIGTADSVTLRFVTPARIRLGGDLQTSVTFPLLVKNLARRLALLENAHGRRGAKPDWTEMPLPTSAVEILKDTLSWQDWGRYSNRQQTKMKLGGFLGDITFAGPAVAEFLPLLMAGETLHVGGATAFGLGQYRIFGASAPENGGGFK